MGRRGRGRRNPWAKADRFTKQARDEGYAARSVFKLKEVQQRFRILQARQRVVDLGCSPGSWSRYVLEVIGKRGALVGVDIAEPQFVGGTVLHRSVTEVSSDEIRSALGGPAHVVLSDMAPRTTGNLLGDHVEQIALAQCALDLAVALLLPGGSFLVKVFDGEDAPAFVAGMRPFFGKVKRLRPGAVRRESREFFVLGSDFKPPSQ